MPTVMVQETTIMGGTINMDKVVMLSIYTQNKETMNQVTGQRDGGIVVGSE